MSVDLTGQKYGRWLVLGPGAPSDRGERKWRCACDCGTERDVLERVLISGGSRSCGCLRRERASAANAHRLEGRGFGDLTVLGRAADQERNGGIWWRCRCSCGGEYEAPATLLVTGKRTHCGCKTQKNQPIMDISGKRFGRLTALHPTDGRDSKGSVMWHCRCDCGTELEVSYNMLSYSGIKSCGCQKREHDRKLGGFIRRVDGTSVDHLKSEKIPVNNTTGVKGVYLNRGKYVAKIVFRKKQYFLGAYDSIDEAARARREDQEKLSGELAEYYERWQRRAAADPEWAAANPVRISVEKDGLNHFNVSFWPILN